MIALPSNLQDRMERAVKFFWATRARQQKKGRKKGQGTRGAVTGGAHMDAFAEIIGDLVLHAGLSKACIYRKDKDELPGYFRPTKEWDLIVVSKGNLLAVVELKSQVGSFGNNFNNRTEEALGSALCLWTAYRENAFKGSVRPWLGYFSLLEDCPKSCQPVRVREPHFEVLSEFKGASYAKRCEIFCRKLVLERHYNSAAFLLSCKEEGIMGGYKEPAEDLCFIYFARSLVGHLKTYV